MVAPAIAIAFALGRVVASRVVTKHAIRYGSKVAVRVMGKAGFRLASVRTAGGRTLRSQGKRLAAGAGLHRASRYAKSGSTAFQRSKKIRNYGYYSSAKSAKGHYQRYRGTPSASSSRSLGRRRHSYTTSSGYTYYYYRKKSR